ncbi:hypothetical protein NE237_000227 [Protea cynaroides]|uniref:Uncharacterized protein n=1 Tax=Protea cynaroides TaxID=273540 RepID=A0A9Q0KRM7_9MAGN|nr:hypothetical protein NE237_000227 [Protea cynaroides]
MESAYTTDISSLFLFEATGDSDFSLDADHEIPMADDDAESCSYGLSCSIDDPNYCSDQDSYEMDNTEYESDDQEWATEKMRSSQEFTVDSPSTEQEEGVVDSANANWKLMTEMEKSKLFWETCLAS